MSEWVGECGSVRLRPWGTRAVRGGEGHGLSWMQVPRPGSTEWHCQSTLQYM